VLRLLWEWIWNFDMLFWTSLVVTFDHIKPVFSLSWVPHYLPLVLCMDDSDLLIFKQNKIKLNWFQYMNSTLYILRLSWQMLLQW
jgi:hypothetical protein